MTFSTCYKLKLKKIYIQIILNLKCYDEDKNFEHKMFLQNTSLSIKSAGVTRRMFTLILTTSVINLNFSHIFHQFTK